LMNHIAFIPGWGRIAYALLEFSRAQE
jgi:hypothetical protein